MTGPHSNSIFNFLGKLHTGSHGVHTALLPHRQPVGVPVPTLSPAFLVTCFLVDNSSGSGEVGLKAILLIVQSKPYLGPLPVSPHSSWL